MYPQRISVDKMEPSSEPKADTTRPGPTLSSTLDRCQGATRQQTSSYTQYRAPSEHGQALISPALSESASLISENRAKQADQKAFSDLRERARRDLHDEAIRFTSQYRDVPEIHPSQERHIIMSGHQPTLFHAGVWFKNFALAKIAKQEDATPINLIIDNDIAAGCSIRVPMMDPITGAAHYRSIHFDQAGGGIPYEQTEIADIACFDSFAERVIESIQPIVQTPCVKHLWMHANSAKARSNNLGHVLAEARHSLETHCGLQTLEVPLSTICNHVTFFDFILRILSELPRFHQCYNESIMDYRLAHRIRSTSHPVPNLRVKEDSLEAPLWIYGKEDSKRRPAWVRLGKDHLLIHDGASRQHRIDLRNPSASAEQLHSLVNDRFKIRPRAIITTMYARMILSDLFIHGIGGGKYDQLGDQITRSFFGIDPLAFTVISATAKLPFTQASKRTPDTRTLHRSIRDTIYQPEKFESEFDLPSPILEKKRLMLQEIPAKGKRKQWHLELEQLNQQLASHLNEKRNHFRTELEQAQVKSAANRIVNHREHSFCLFDLNYLSETFKLMLNESPNS